jgi:hypothetical protein
MTRAATLLEARRALLVSRCELDRIELALAWHDVARSVGLTPRAGSARTSWIGRALGYAIPLVGAARARRLSRYLSLALLVYRIATAWRARAR